MTNQNCKGIGRFLGHKFEARYSVKRGSARVLQFHEIPTMTVNIPAALEATRSLDRVYHHDICVRCGLVVNKERT